MTTINPYSVLSNGNYSLTQSTGTAGSAASTTSATANTAASTTDTTSLAYMLNLSPQAQNYLSSGITGSSASASSGSFTLSAQQQKQLDAIIEKHRGEPYTQETFDAIQEDLVKSGLSPDQLAQQAKVNAFNPTLSLLDALSGTNSNAQLIPTDSQLQTKIQTYVNDVARRFEKVAAAEDDA
ncbi:MAG: hypothetical protein V4735_04920 [Pseudomonadota bacterium]